MSDLEEPGLEYLPAGISQRKLGQPRKYAVGLDGAARIAKTGETVQEIRDTGYDTDIDPAVTHIRGHEAELGVTQQRAMTYVPPAREQQHNPDADYQRAVLANTRVVPAAAADSSASRLGAETARFQTELAIAQQAAVNQVRAQQQADAEAAERAAPVAVAQNIARLWNATARTSHR